MNNLLRAVFLIYFFTHIPITIVLDAQALIGFIYPRSLQDFNTWYFTTFNDALIRSPPIWLQSFIFEELLLQLPFFFIATYGLIKKKNWIRIPSIVYGAHVSTTVWAILPEIWVSSASFNEKLLLTLFYGPYFVIPMLLCIYMCIFDVPFPEYIKKKV